MKHQVIRPDDATLAAILGRATCTASCDHIYVHCGDGLLLHGVVDGEPCSIIIAHTDHPHPVSYARYLRTIRPHDRCHIIMVCDSDPIGYGKAIYLINHTIDGLPCIDIGPDRTVVLVIGYVDADSDETIMRYIDKYGDR